MRASKEQLVFFKEQLRIHREWFDHKWVPPLQQKNDESNEAAKPDESNEAAKPDESNEAAKPDEFVQGAIVEVSSDEEGFSGAWFEATIVEAKGNDKFLVEYQTLLADDDSNLLREEIDVFHIRPPPPNTNVDGQFNLLDEVDALYNDGWWVGVISKVLADSKYVIYFRSSNEELEFHHSHLRLHQDWIHGKWVMPSKAMKL
ncbi:protein AGENET DOMAIN (AGD)-CONTAINING P1 [Vigna angularis]|uniref:protein AGENET DOMAIN (AGD)-CONTAINING P1 n=1 Tax=Phaseolus angularis TaxID=3914 RepID=UPI0022B55EDE|nr:protein AGENET DOMAIN (AGD)-CONTAINING P1 [Vigna angularis]